MLGLMPCFRLNELIVFFRPNMGAMGRSSGCERVSREVWFELYDVDGVNQQVHL